jgi:alkanesulfonate monooxygenase SsuD/methylene tetrahydromethanopterin reductase-like flavin-dependent oxidoreductase (luciferase family)
MKFGIYIGPTYPGDMDGASAFDLARRMARTANESGFDGIFAAHHYSTGPSQTIFHPLLVLARLSAECPEGYLGTAVYLARESPTIAGERLPDKVRVVRALGRAL